MLSLISYSLYVLYKLSRLTRVAHITEDSNTLAYQNIIFTADDYYCVRFRVRFALVFSRRLYVNRTDIYHIIVATENRIFYRLSSSPIAGPAAEIATTVNL